jgi:hypothetical protein
MDANIIAGVIFGAPIIPAIDNPPIIKAPNRNIGIPKRKLIIAITFPTSYSSIEVLCLFKVELIYLP